MWIKMPILITRHSICQTLPKNVAFTKRIMYKIYKYSQWIYKMKMNGISKVPLHYIANISYLKHKINNPVEDFTTYKGNLG